MAFEPPTLVGRHVHLSPLQAEHAPALLEAANAARATYAFTIVPADRVAMDAYVAEALSEQRAGRTLPFVVRDATGAIVGSTRFHDIEYWKWPSEPAAPVPTGPDAVEIGYTWYAERVQRTALNTEAKLLLCTHAFETWRVRRITWKTDVRNVRSRVAIERLGAKLDGCLRAHRPGVDGTVRDTVYYSMLASEWPACRAALIEKLERGSVTVSDAPVPPAAPAASR
jgi:RimJ/RimL family protein N-acetyltransferase